MVRFKDLMNTRSERRREDRRESLKIGTQAQGRRQIIGPFITGSIYLMFFLSGSAALVYQVVWVRSLTLIFGGSHFAVAVVLSIFMAGLAIGGYIVGRQVDRTEKPLKLYGLLEIGIAVFGVVFMGLMKVYPSIYIPLAQWKEDSPLYLLIIRILFSVVALIIPTVLMGGTLPVLSKFVSRQPKNLRAHLPLLYGLNTLGAVLGAATVGFFLLRFYSVSTALYFAILTNLLIGLASTLLQGQVSRVVTSDPSRGEEKELPEPTPQLSSHDPMKSLFPIKLVLWGIGISGFCALGYEVLWTRTLTIVVGGSVYSFTTILIAFLTGIALGSAVYGLVPKIFRMRDKGPRRSILWFGIVEIIIGVSALFVSLNIRDLPMNILRLHRYFEGIGISLSGVRLWSSFTLAFFYMVVPAFFMGVAFPLVGKVHAEYRKVVGGAVGEVLAFNTLGAILGSAISGFFMIRLFGIERSLQMLTVLNIGLGLLVLFSLKEVKALNWIISGLTLAALLLLGIDQNAFTIWNKKYFAIIRTNQLEAFDTPEKIKEAIENTDVLYYAEGTEFIVSSFRAKDGKQSFVVNGRTEASSYLHDQQCLFALGHLPMLLHKNPKLVLVVGLGTGMTLGATSVHPSVERMILAEIEPKVVGVAKTFEDYNHHVLDDPKLTIVFNDGRNFLMTTRKKFDVITADPIHPWSQGAGYLYTAEYFKLVSEHLLPGGIACQWLPIYELSVEDLKSVIITFRRNFKYTMMWVTYSDALIIGSNSPIAIDEEEMDRRIAEPKISEDLKRVMMGNATDFLSYFVMGNDGMKAFSEDGIINTDNNLYIEFSAPFSISDPSVIEENVNAIIRYGENILPYLVPADGKAARAEQERRWSRHREAVDVTTRAVALFMQQRLREAKFQKLLDEISDKYPSFAPGRLLKQEYRTLLGLKELQKVDLAVIDEKGLKTVVEISAVFVPVSPGRGSVVFVDNNANVTYGELNVEEQNKTEFVSRFASGVMMDIQTTYQRALENAQDKTGNLPLKGAILRKIRETITWKIKEGSRY